MEAIASFFILFTTYFLGFMALVQLGIRPLRKLVIDPSTHRRIFVSNHSKIILWSLGLALITTFVAYWAFP
ncbi:MAG: hypothetical protein ACJLTB_10335 [Algoriphagus aquaeductus]|uniref:hypothetical protein n=1 Tax=Algoriphagus aquaeductus TaxID=475299 RepID=UPI00387998AF